ncbi:MULTISPECIES: hypothetical protein [Rhizobium]|uniref:hypothetical protein n=1 Tax=Rhizobium TaxID=379 RepID=UPI001146EEDA|nr:MULTISPECIES: hypothetical protein [Rhizobium]MCS0457761.1 hypothetical protein [Rhizobium favelukesii]UFS83920.1 hypothetical protein LPB79_17250 [Rhizobium sp. T136]
MGPSATAGPKAQIGSTGTTPVDQTACPNKKPIRHSREGKPDGEKRLKSDKAATANPHFIEWPGLSLSCRFVAARCAVPFDGIKSKKIPIVQPILTSERQKSRFENFMMENQIDKKTIFAALCTW